MKKHIRKLSHSVKYTFYKFKTTKTQHVKCSRERGRWPLPRTQLEPWDVVVVVVPSRKQDPKTGMVVRMETP